GTLSGPLRHKTHLLFTWLNDLIRRPSILDAVEDIIGPNILCSLAAKLLPRRHPASARLILKLLYESTELMPSNYLTQIISSACRSVNSSHPAPVRRRT